MPAELECPNCDGFGCEGCNFERVLRLEGCPKDLVGDFAFEINLASTAIDGMFPVSAGMLDQAAYFIDLMQLLKADRNKIKAEQQKERKRGRHRY